MFKFAVLRFVGTNNLGQSLHRFIVWTTNLNRVKILVSSMFFRWRFVWIGLYLCNTDSFIQRHTRMQIRTLLFIATNSGDIFTRALISKILSSLLYIESIYAVSAVALRLFHAADDREEVMLSLQSFGLLSCNPTSDVFARLTRVVDDCVNKANVGNDITDIVADLYEDLSIKTYMLISGLALVYQEMLKKDCISIADMPQLFDNPHMAMPRGFRSLCCSLDMNYNRSSVCKECVKCQYDGPFEDYTYNVCFKLLNICMFFTMMHTIECHDNKIDLEDLIQHDINPDYSLDCYICVFNQNNNKASRGFNEQLMLNNSNDVNAIMHLSEIIMKS